MSVTLTISKSLDGAAVSDALAGGGTNGVDLGSVVNNQYAPITDKSLNTGKQSLFIRHDAAVDPITDVKTFVQEYGTGTGFSYGGANSPALDFTALRTLANGSGDSKNNNDGLSGGLWADQDADVASTNQFDFATNGRDSSSSAGNGTVIKYGDQNTDGIDLTSAFQLDSDAMVIDSDQGQGGDGTNGYIPTAPVDGQIGKDADTALGDNGHTKLRIYVPDAYTDGGILQWEWVIAYSFTA